MAGPNEQPDAKTPPHGTQALLQDATRDFPEQPTSLYSPAEQALIAGTASASALPWSGGLQPHARIGRYELLERLYRGESTEIYVARTPDNQLVALKLTLPEYKHTALFLEDAHSAAALKVPGLVPVLDIGEAAGRTFVAMEYVHGRDAAMLARCMTASGGPSRPFALKVALELAQVIERLQARGVTHGSITSEHVMVSDHGEVKLCAGTGSGDDVAAVLSVLRELLGGDAGELGARPFASAAELVQALAAEIAAAAPADLRMMVRALVGISLASEKRKVADALGRPRATRSGDANITKKPRPAGRGWLLLVLGLLVAAAVAVWLARFTP